MVKDDVCVGTKMSMSLLGEMSPLAMLPCTIVQDWTYPEAPLSALPFLRSRWRMPHRFA